MWLKTLVELDRGKRETQVSAMILEFRVDVVLIEW